MNCARRSIGTPASTFSLDASSRKRAGATTRTLRLAISSAEITPSTPPKWSMWLCVKITAVTGFAPSVFSTSRHAAAAVSRAVSGSTTIRPVLPSMIVMFETS